MQIRKMAVMLLTVVFLSACTNTGPKQTGGTLLGGISGALLGSTIGKGNGKLVAVALGTLAGAYIGGSVGQQLDENDKAMANKTVAYALEKNPDYQTAKWHNPNTQNSGTVMVTNTQQVSANKVCRDYVQDVYVAGQAEPVKLVGKACRDVRDTQGQWYIQS